MTIKQQGGVFGRNPTFGDLTTEDIEVTKLTGRASPDPAQVTIKTTDNGSGWSTSDPWGRLAFYNSDGSGGGPKIHATMDAIARASAGSYSKVSFKTSDVSTDTLTEVLRFEPNSKDVVVSNGNLVIETSGAGIDFSATADGSGTTTSELLADYEEGTWTPVPFGATSAGTYSTTFVAGNYILVGKIITINCTVAVTSFTGTGDFRISGLPYAAAASQGSLLTVQYNNSPFATLTSTNQLVVGQLNSSEIRFRASSSVAGGAFETPQCSASTVSYLRVSGSYEVA